MDIEKVLCWIGIHNLWKFKLGPRCGYTTSTGISIQSRDAPVEGRYCSKCHHVEIWTDGDVHVTDPKDNVISVKYK